jgi:hypothetical protein
MLSLTYGIRVVVELLLQTWPKDGEVKIFLSTWNKDEEVKYFY